MQNFAMIGFKDRQDVEEWLEPLSYEEFWQETAPFALALQSKESCDRQIARGIVDEAVVLDALKGMARLEIIEMFNLPVRDTMPWYSLH
jgi:hypothetical protein